MSDDQIGPHDCINLKIQTKAATYICWRQALPKELQKSLYWETSTQKEGQLERERFWLLLSPEKKGLFTTAFCAQVVFE